MQDKISVYVASSWRNQLQQKVVNDLRLAGFEVYDFTNPAEGDNGFHWSEIDKDWKQWNPEQFVAHLASSPIAERGFKTDMLALSNCDICILLNPCGKSAHLEAGYAIGRAKPVIIYLDKEKFEPELMYKLSTFIATSLDDIVTYANMCKHGILEEIRRNEYLLS